MSVNIFGREYLNMSAKRLSDRLLLQRITIRVYDHERKG
jgi:hypothetical protein